MTLITVFKLYFINSPTYLKLNPRFALVNNQCSIDSLNNALNIEMCVCVCVCVCVWCVSDNKIHTYSSGVSKRA